MNKKNPKLKSKFNLPLACLVWIGSMYFWLALLVYVAWQPNGADPTPFIGVSIIGISVIPAALAGLAFEVQT